MKLEPIGDRLVAVLSDADRMTSGGLHIPDNVEGNDTLFATVLAVGPGLPDKDGLCSGLPVKRDDKILVSKFSGITVEVMDQCQIILRIDEVLSIVKG